MPAPTEESRVATFARSAAKDLLIGLAIGLGLYVLWVIGHSILFG